MKEYNEIKIGYDALTLSVNPQNSILKNKKGLTSQEIQKYSLVKLKRGKM